MFRLSVWTLIGVMAVSMMVSAVMIFVTGSTVPYFFFWASTFGIAVLFHMVAEIIYRVAISDYS